MSKIVITKRVTSLFLASIPPNVQEFNAFVYAVVPRKDHKIIEGEYGKDVRLDPCYLDWVTKTITITIHLNINPGIQSIEDLKPEYFESLQAAFLALLLSCS